MPDMKKRRIVIPENYLERIPMHSDSVRWSADGDGAVTLEIENKGCFNRIAQLLLRKPKQSFIHLDTLGSFVWQRIDGKRSITELGELVDGAFGEEASPIYERLASYFRILESYGFVGWVDASEAETE